MCRWFVVVFGRFRRFLRGVNGMHFAAMFFMGPLAAVAIVGLREIHLVAPTPLWLIPAILVGGQMLTTTAGFWWDGSPDSRIRLHAWIGSQAVLVTAVIYATGWGPALASGWCSSVRKRWSSRVRRRSEWYWDGAWRASLLVRR